MVMLCMNDYNGNESGRVWRISLDDVISLEWGFWPPSTAPRCYRFGFGDSHWLKLSRRKFRTFGYQSWVGNMCWNAVWMTPETVAHFLNYAHGLGFNPDHGLTAFWNKLIAKEGIAAQDILKSIEVR